VTELADEERFSFTPFTRHPLFTHVNRWIVERVVCPGRHVIVDLGCGPGAVTKLIVDRLNSTPGVRVIGVDPSASALEKARAAIPSTIVEFVQGSAERLSRLVRDADAVLFLNAIHLVPDKAQVIAEIRRALHAGGVFAFNTTFFNGAYVEGTTGFWRRWVVRAVQVLAAADAPAKTVGSAHYFRYKPSRVAGKGEVMPVTTVIRIHNVAGAVERRHNADRASLLAYTRVHRSA